MAPVAPAPVFPPVAPTVAPLVARFAPSRYLQASPYGQYPQYSQCTQYARHSPYASQHPQDTPATENDGLEDDEVEYVSAEPPRPRTPDMYFDHFDECGNPITTPTHRRSQRVSLLPNSRGAFLKYDNKEMTMEELLSFVRGGRVERVDFTPQHGCAGVYFVLAEHARDYIRFCHRWNGPGRAQFTRVEAIPCAKGGHEPIKENIGKSIKFECATRILLVDNLPVGTRVDKVTLDVKAQSGKLRVRFESLVIDEQARRCTLRMASIGTCLGARMRLRRLPWYRYCEYSFGPDLCEGPVQELQ